MIHGTLKSVKEDGRRKIEEFSSLEGDFSIQLFTILSEQPLGDHYHEEKDEIFVILEGSGKLVTDSIDKEAWGGGRYLNSCELKIGSVVLVKKRVAHRFILEPGSKMICFSSKAFDENDFHTHEFPD